MSEPTIWAKAKAEIQRRGWYQGDFAPVLSLPESNDCEVCLAGALYAVTTGDPWGDGTEQPVIAQLAGELVERGVDDSDAYDSIDVISHWNDNPSRTVNEVYVLLDELDAVARGES